MRVEPSNGLAARFNPAGKTDTDGFAPGTAGPGKGDVGQMRQTARRAGATGLLGLSLSACVVSINDEAPDRAEAVPPPPVPMVCDAEPAQYHVGHDATRAMGEAILKDSGARTLRWGPPDAAWTMDYRQDRVNVRYDARMKIVEITCG